MTDLKDYNRIVYSYHITQTIILVIALLATACGQSNSGGSDPAPAATDNSLKFEGDFATACENKVIASVKNRNIKSILRYETFSDAECKKSIGFVVYERTIKVGKDIDGKMFAVDVTNDSMTFTINDETLVGKEYYGFTDWKLTVATEFSGVTSHGVAYPPLNFTAYQVMRIDGDSLQVNEAVWLLPGKEGMSDSERSYKLEANSDFVRVAN